MSGSLQDTLRGVVDRSTSSAADPEPEGDYFAKLTASVLKRRDITPTEKTALLGIDRCCRDKGETDASDQQMAEECGLSLSTFQRVLRKLKLKGLVVALGNTCRRIIRLLTRFRRAGDPPRLPSPVEGTPLNGDANGRAALPSPVRGVPLTDGAKSPHGRSELPSSVRDSSKERDQSSKARSSSSSPAPGDTPTTAKTEDPPRPSAPPPPVPSDIAEQSERELASQWQAVPEPVRSEVEATVRAEKPWASRPKVFLSLCLAELESRPAPPPTDREVRAAVMFLDATDPAMRLASARSLIDWGRADLVVDRIEFEAIKRTGRQPLAGLPAGPKSPCRPPG